jgi:putative acetyltransferase
MIVRPENPHTPTERSEIRSVNEAAFGRPDEANLVDTLRSEVDTRRDKVVLASLVAESEHRIVGHILFSRIWIETVPAVALAPVAVLPENQRQGIAGALISRGIDLMRTRGEQIILVLGHPEYYERFGFAAETARNLETPSRPTLSWRWNSAPERWLPSAARSDILPPSDSPPNTPAKA